MKQVMSKHKDTVQQILLVVAAFLGTCGINYVCSLAAGIFFSNGVFSAMVCIGLYVLLKLTWQDIQKLETRRKKIKRFLFAFLLAEFFCALMIAGYQLKMKGLTETGFKGKGLILLRGATMSLAVLPFTNYMFAWLERIRDVQMDIDASRVWNGKKVFFICWLVIFACWIPVFLAYYPSIMSYDFHRQSQEAVRGFIWFNSYQPLAHTWIIWLFLTIGKALGSYQIGMALFSLVQMLVFSAACSYSCVTVYRLIRRKCFVVVMTAFFALFPFISVLSVATTKDVYFSALFLIFVCLFVERTFLCDRKKQKWFDALWVLEGSIMILFRNNALYAIAVFVIFYVVLVGKKQRVRALVLCLLLLIAGKGAQEGVRMALGTQIHGSQIEMYSVPLQQMARVGLYNGDALSKEHFIMLNHYVPQEYWVKYNPAISDSIKGDIGAYVYDYTWKGNTKGLLEVWMRIGLAYPNEYIDAFLLLTNGYWFFDDVTWAEVLGYGLEGRMGAIYTYNSTISEVIPEGIEHESKFPALELALEKIVSANCFMEWPVISNLFKPAFYCWGLLFMVLASIYMKDAKKTVTGLFPLIYLGTMFLGPVVQSRYVLPVIVVLPLLYAVLLWKKQDE